MLFLHVICGAVVASVALGGAPALASDGLREPDRAHAKDWVTEWSLGRRHLALGVPLQPTATIARTVGQPGPATAALTVFSFGMTRTFSSLYLGGDYELGVAGTHTPVTADHPADPRGLGLIRVAAIGGLRGDLGPIALGAEVALGGQIIHRNYGGSPDDDLGVTLHHAGLTAEARLRAGVWASRRWRVGVLHGTSLLDDGWATSVIVGYAPGR